MQRLRLSKPILGKRPQTFRHCTRPTMSFAMNQISHCSKHNIIPQTRSIQISAHMLPTDRQHSIKTARVYGKAIANNSLPMTQKQPHTYSFRSCTSKNDQKGDVADQKEKEKQKKKELKEFRHEQIKKQIKATIQGADLREFATTQGKVITSGRELISPSQSRMFPGISGAHSLANRKEKVTFPGIFKTRPAAFVVVSQKRVFLEKQIMPWRSTWHHFFPELKDCYFDITCVDDPIYRGLGRAMEYFVKATVRHEPERLQEMYYYYSNTLKNPADDLIFRALDMTNQYTNYVFLVDHNARIRWFNSGAPAIDELENLSDLTSELMQNAPPKVFRPRLLSQSSDELNPE